MKVNFGDISIGIDVEAEPGVADSGHLDFDLSELLTAVGEAAKAQNTAVALFIDELQYVEESQLAALIAALHRAAQRQLPVTLVGAGLSQLVAHAAAAKSYAERLFSFPEIGPLPEGAARYALEAPANERGVAFHPDALASIVEHAECYPYFIQEWGKHSWDCAAASPITAEDVAAAAAQATAELDASFFRARFDRLAPSEKRYLRAMAELGPGPHRSGEISTVLSRGVGAVAPTRAKLIEKGVIYSPAHGDTGFTAPLFNEHLKRVLPQWPPD